MSRHPVGATWKGIEKRTGKIGHIWLENRSPLGLEMWRWAWSYGDGSRPLYAFDWNTTYRACREQLALDCRMKRIA